eukprot:CAMPEP_0175434132 /NCGR_PEP_ID=MMETSP0095-20121207/53746_1 /TAXON_ID=311494 /ORGANISM="Alexandrium monilatum, Strain CCMP3105" /LENGTH=90 /DNA_ID=CAMNT_0016733663 /DNA_START=52 /DNA_END=321 /DNA_ORIENTATION=+
MTAQFRRGPQRGATSGGERDGAAPPSPRGRGRLALCAPRGGPASAAGVERRGGGAERGKKRARTRAHARARAQTTAPAPRDRGRTRRQGA